jgi:hypothetical protein
MYHTTGMVGLDEMLRVPDHTATMERAEPVIEPGLRSVAERFLETAPAAYPTRAAQTVVGLARRAEDVLNRQRVVVLLPGELGDGTA